MIKEVLGAFRDWLSLHQGDLAKGFIKFLGDVAYAIGFIVGVVEGILQKLGVFAQPTAKDVATAKTDIAKGVVAPAGTAVRAAQNKLLWEQVQEQGRSNDEATRKLLSTIGTGASWLWQNTLGRIGGGSNQGVNLGGVTINVSGAGDPKAVAGEVTKQIQQVITTAAVDPSLSPMQQANQ